MRCRRHSAAFNKLTPNIALCLRPLSQERIDHGTLLRWTKGFGAAGVEGNDVVAMFRKALDKNVSDGMTAS